VVEQVAGVQEGVASESSNQHGHPHGTPLGGAVWAEPVRLVGTRASRVAWATVFVLAAAVLTTAALLTPDPSGVGTHQQLGLPPCGFLVVTGLPCPACGMTTSFSHMIRFEAVSACISNPIGAMLFLLTVAAVPVSGYGLLRNRRVAPMLERLHVDKIAILVAVALVVTWGVRVAAILLR